MCFPRFNGGACFCALLGGEYYGYWQIAPVEPIARVTRRYLPDTLALETDFQTGSGTVRIIDFMPQRSVQPDLVRIVTGLQGSVKMRMRSVIRFD